MSVIHTIHDRDKRGHQLQISRWDGRGSNIFTLQDPRLDRQHIPFIRENRDVSTLMADVMAARERFERESLELEREIQQLNKNITRLQGILDIIDKRIDEAASRPQWHIANIIQGVRRIQAVGRRCLDSTIAIPMIWGGDPVDQPQTNMRLAIQ